MNKFETLYQEIMFAVRPEEIFGVIRGDPADKLKELKLSYERISREINPGNFIDDLDIQELALEAKVKLDSLYQQARAAIAIKLPIKNPAGAEYSIIKGLGSTPTANLYHCQFGEGGGGIFKIARSLETNPNLDREALVLRTLLEKALAVEFENTGDKAFNYQYFFPKLFDSFIASSQKDRRINIVGFPDEDLIDKLKSLSWFINKEKVFFDPRTGAWILGKLLKVMAFAYSQGVHNPIITTGNILIEKDEHGLVLFDWASAEFCAPSSGIQSKGLAQAGKIALEIMGGNIETGQLPTSDQLEDDRFQDFIFKMSQGKLIDASIAHSQFYELIYELWPRGFHKFVCYKRKER